MAYIQVTMALQIPYKGFYYIMTTGEIMMVVPVPEEGVHRRWELMSDGTMGVKTFRFMQKDINEGRIFYKHQGLHQEDNDFFTFEVSFATVRF